MEKRWVPFVVLGLIAIGAAAQAEFGIQSISLTNNNVRIAWNAPGGSNYVVQSATGTPGYTNNFTDLSPVIFVPGSSEVLTNYTHINGALNITSRFYRVRSSTPTSASSLLLVPTNMVTGITMTNRFLVWQITGITTQDVTSAALLTSFNPSIASVIPGISNGFALVQANAQGTATLSAVYQNQTSSVPLVVSQLIGLTTDPPLSTLQNYVGVTNSVTVIGQLLNGQSRNITPASRAESLNFGEPATNDLVTRVNYLLTPDVANSLALIVAT